MAVRSDFLKTTEAAVAAGVGLREVNRAIDEDILPKEFIGEDDSRYVVPGACALILFYFDAASQLTSEERRFVIRRVSSKLRKWKRKEAFHAPNEDWLIRHNFVAIDFASFVERAGDRLEQLAAAERVVVSSPDVLSGTPVIKGTRIPVYDIAASVEAGASRDRLLAAYPSLEAAKIDLAVLYAKANPSRGRPRAQATRPAGSTLLTDRRVKRRPKAE